MPMDENGVITPEPMIAEPEVVRSYLIMLNNGDNITIGESIFKALLPELEADPRFAALGESRFIHKDAIRMVAEGKIEYRNIQPASHIPGALPFPPRKH